jgi:hypothetical protein
MHRPIRFVAPPTVVTLAALVVAAGARAGSSGPTLLVNYDGAGPTVTLPNGTPVGTTTPPGTLLPAGAYTVDITVTSGSPQFQIVGPGVNFLDDEPTEEVFTITFLPNSTYTYEDVADPAATVGVFSTTATIAASPATTNPKTSTNAESNSDPVGAAVSSPAEPGQSSTLTAVVTGSETTLSLDGRPVSHVRAGRYRLVIVDRSRSAGFLLRMTGHPASTATGAAFTGTRSLTVDLAAGTWLYSAGSGRDHAFLVTA